MDKMSNLGLILNRVAHGTEQLDVTEKRHSLDRCVGLSSLFSSTASDRDLTKQIENVVRECT